MRSSSLIVIAASILFSTSPVLACEASGPGKHVGQVLDVDRENGAFSIMDAEKMAAISFSADKSILERLENTDRLAIVEFEDTADGLRAISVTLQ